MEITKIHGSIVLATAGVGIVLSTIVYAALTASQTIPTAGIVRALGVDVYWDRECTRRVSAIEWGYVAPGTRCNRTVYVYNGGTVAAVLSMNTGNWTPQIASNYITLSWNCEGDVLYHERLVQATLTLNVPSDITGVDGFSFDIIIAGTENT